jgi:hypothetical protein
VCVKWAKAQRAGVVGVGLSSDSMICVEENDSEWAEVECGRVHSGWVQWVGAAGGSVCGGREVVVGGGFSSDSLIRVEENDRVGRHASPIEC